MSQQTHPGHLPEPLSRDELPPEQRTPLARFGGEAPPAPAWFKAAVAHAPERRRLAAPGGALEVLTWGDVGKPGLLLAHGNFASVDWFDFFAPFFAGTHRVAAFSLAGMGLSDWRDRYGFEDFAEDAEAVAQATGLYEGGRPPVYVGQSFGAGLSLYVAAERPERMSGLAMVDANFRAPPPQALEARLQQSAAQAKAAPRTFPSLAAAVAKFRLLPAQPVENLYILDHIARASFRRAPGTEEAWAWKYDPAIAAKIDYEERTAFFASKPHIGVPIAHFYGDQSQISVHGEAARAGPFPAHGLEIGIPEAGHHIIIDQPLALVSALRAVLAGWRA